MPFKLCKERFMFQSVNEKYYIQRGEPHLRYFIFSKKLVFNNWSEDIFNIRTRKTKNLMPKNSVSISNNQVSNLDGDDEPSNIIL